ncbi:alpha/beta hydrolase [Fulvivirga sp. M361]|uniref:alpha/beta fold hydrolase n=1 Tax=Fulvivirga sp. M361 TaxID=2594266 RepID=UPI00117AC063|nr:alpha/beta hydrolase [Fulvivirga sp. M361]TRX58613.1 alpha/beta hydrolase [Fulvivirga sp. M361]
MTDNLNTYYYSKGSGTTVVLVHGFCETSDLWHNFSHELAETYEVLVPDLPGFGKNDLLPDDFTIREVSEWLYRWLVSLAKKEVVIIGHSLGGYVGLELAKQHPEMLLGLGLFHSTAFADPEEKKLLRNKVIEFVEEQGVKVFADAFVSQLFYAPNRKHLATEVDKAVATAGQTPLNTLIQYTKAMRDRLDRTDILKSGIPLLFIAGEQDTSVPLERSEAQLPMIKKGKAHILKNTGHMGMFEAREEALQVIKGFLKSIL